MAFLPLHCKCKFLQLAERGEPGGEWLDFRGEFMKISHNAIFARGIPFVVLALLLAHARAAEFTTPPRYPLASSGVSVRADFNGDGRVDVASASGILSIALGQSGGSFKLKYQYTLSYGPIVMVAADFNRDGKMDIAISGTCFIFADGGCVSVFLGNGDGTFQAEVDYDSGGQFPAGLGTADFDGDGIPDLVVSDREQYLGSDSVLAVLYGNGDGTFYGPFGTVLNYWYYYGPVVVGDFNGDRKPDVAVGFDEGVLIFINNGGGFLPAVPYDPTVYVTGLAAGDMNGDGHLDLVTTDAVILGNGDGSFQSPIAFSGGNFPALADVNGDGKLDIVEAFYNSAGVLLGNGDGTVQPPIIFNVTGPSAILVADVNRDGHPDLLVPGNSLLTVVYGNGDGTFQAPPILPVSTGPLITGDFNADGKLDVATVNYTQVGVFLGNGDGTFQSELQFAAGKEPDALTAADFNGDGKLDLAVGNIASLNVSILFGNGDGTFQVPVNYRLSEYGGTSLTAADFNGDGKPDLAVIEESTHGMGKLNILLNNGDGTFQKAVVYAVGGGPGSVAVGDFNGDGKIDVAVNNSLASVVVLLGNGDGTLQTGVRYSTRYTGGQLRVADFNHDGYQDLLLGTESDLVVLPGKGDGTFGPPIISATSPYTYVSDVALADFNSDGNVDVAEAGTGFSVGTGAGNGKFKTVFYGTGAANVAAGDFNGDGAPDVILNVRSGLVVLLNTGHADGSVFGRGSGREFRTK